MILFFAAHLVPGDPIILYIGQDSLSSLTPEEIDNLRHEFGLDKPIFKQYLDWVNGVLHGDLGDSIFWGDTVKEELARAIPVSVFFGIVAFLISIIVGVVLGIITAVRRGEKADIVLTALANLGIAIPEFWLGIILIYIFGLYLHWFPPMGYVSPLKDFADSMHHMILPVICLALFPIASMTRQTRSAMLEVIQQDYIRTAWAKGVPERKVIFAHALKNGVNPVITLAGMNIPRILGGQVMIETVFNIPGMGRLATNAVFSRDYAVIQGVALVMVVTVVLSNLLVDISYGWLDPRIHYD